MAIRPFWRRPGTGQQQPDADALAAAARDPAAGAWALLRPRVQVSDGRFCLTATLTVAHAGQAAAQVHGRVLAVQVLRSGDDIGAATPDQCHRRALPLAHALDPASLRVELQGDDLIIVARVLAEAPAVGTAGLRRTAWRALATAPADTPARPARRRATPPASALPGVANA